MRRNSSPRGVTLLELAIVLGIIAILAGLTAANLQKVKTRGSFNAEANKIVTEMKRTRIEALNRGSFTAFVIDTAGNRWWGVQSNDPIGSSTALTAFLTAFAAAPTTYCAGLPTCAVLTSGTLSGSPSISFGPTTGWGATLPAPMTSIASTNSTKCSFCGSSPSGWGAVLFTPAGQVIFSTTPSTGIGAHFSMTGTRDVSVARVKTVAIVARTGLIESFDKP